MAFWNRRDTLTEAIADWESRDLLEASAAATLRDDVLSRTPSRSFATIAMFLGVVCLAFGAITFVAANWEAMSTFSRVLLLFICLWTAWGAGIFFRIRQRDVPAEMCIFLACVLFGATIMLLGQIYHMQGNAKDAVWLWALGALVGSLLSRSAFALCLSIALWTFWGLWDTGDLFKINRQISLHFPVAILICGAAAYWMRSRKAGHLTIFGVALWAAYLSLRFIDARPPDSQPLVISLSLSLIILAMALISDADRRWLKGFERPAIIYSLLMVIGLAVVWYIATDQRWNGEWKIIRAPYWPGGIAVIATIALAVYARAKGNPNRYDVAVTAVFAILYGLIAGFIQRVPFLTESVLLALTIWAIRMGWRLDYPPLSRIGYLAFGGVMVLIYFATVGTLIGTSAFYIGAGVLIVLATIIAPRLLKSKEVQS